MAQGSTNVALSPWNVVALDTFQTPERTQASQWRRSWRAATTWMIGKEASERQAKQESELRALPKVKLAHVAPPIDWLPATERLKQALKDYEDAPVVLFISPPYGGHSTVVSQWAAQQDIPCLTVPTLKELVDGSLAWVEDATQLKRWAIPALEYHFLRHTNGLQGVRELLERALSGRLGQSVMGCDSWTYAYLQHTVGLEGVPVLTLQGLEDQALKHVLPFSDHEALNARFALAQRGILSSQQGRWQVAPLSYASVRQLLESRNYLVDPL